MTLKQYKAFISVAKHRSFSEAAEQTGLSQPTLSRLLKQLEDELEVELIDRYHRPLTLTKTGEFFYRKLKNILLDLDTLSTLTKKMGNPTHNLTIGFVPSILYGLLPDVIARLKQFKPDLELNLQDISSYQQVNALKSGQIDVGLGRFALYDSQIHQILLRHERYILAMPNNHPLASSDHIHLEQIVGDTILLYHQSRLPLTEGSQITEPLLNVFAEFNLTPHNTVKVSDLQVALGLVAAGEGVTLVPDSLKSERTDRVTYRYLIHESATSPIYLQTLKALPHPNADELLEVIYQEYEKRGITYKRQSLTKFV